jgi:hypothetical protein
MSTENLSPKSDKKCTICDNDYKNEEFVSMVHKWRQYGGYSEYSYPRFFCSKECLDIFEKDFRCNHCHILKYDHVEYKKGDDGMSYCNDESEITINDKPCYQQKYPNTF